MQIAFYTLGCKVNQVESEDLAEQLYEAGYEVLRIYGVHTVFVFQNNASAVFVACVT